MRPLWRKGHELHLLEAARYLQHFSEIIRHRSGGLREETLNLGEIADGRNLALKVAAVIGIALAIAVLVFTMIDSSSPRLITCEDVTCPAGYMCEEVPKGLLCAIE